MIVALLGLLIFAAPADSTDAFDACLSIGPSNTPPPVTSLSEAQTYWTEGTGAVQASLSGPLDRVLRARRCYEALDPSKVDRQYLGNILATYVAEAEIRVALREFEHAFETYDSALGYLQSISSGHYAGYQAAKAYWPKDIHRSKGYLYYLLGNLSASIDQYLKVYRLASDPVERAESLISVGLLHQRTQDYRSANRYYTRAEHLARENDLLPAERSLGAWLLQQKADLVLEKTLNTEFDRGAIARAAEMAERGRRLAEPGTERYAWLSIVLSESLGYLGKFDRAYRVNGDVREFARKQDRPQFLAFSLLKRGVLHIQTERWSRAETTLNTALDVARDLRNLDYQRRILRALGRLHEIQGAWIAAESHYRDGIDVIEKYRSSLTASQWSMTAFAQWRDVHRGLVRVLLAQGRERQALAALDRSRARHLQDLRTQARVSNQLPEQDSARFDSLTRALADVRNRLAANSLSPDEKSELQTREASLMADRQRLLQIDSVGARPSIETVADSLDGTERVLVSYFLDDPWPVYGRSPRSVAFVLSADTLRTVSLPNVTQDSVHTRVKSVSRLFSTRRKPTHVNAMHFDLRPLHALHETLYAPISDALPPNRSVTVIPDGPLFHLPFSMLVSEMPGGRFAPEDARFVLEERPISYELASSLVATPRDPDAPRKPSQPSQLAAFGVSEFDGLISESEGRTSSLPGVAIDSSLALPQLPGVRTELESLQHGIRGSRIFLDDAATEEAFWRVSTGAEVLHLASHAFVHPTTPLQNAFLLRSDSLHDKTDGLLFLHELQTQQRPFSLVVLSGCNTARGTLVGGEGMEGLQYAFRAMGTEATVSSLWPVADRPNAVLMESFYEYLGEGYRKDEALRRAKLDHLNAHPEHSSPFFWAPSVLYGSPRRVALQSAWAYPVWAWWTLAGLGLLVAGFMVVRWRPRHLAAYLQE